MLVRITKDAGPVYHLPGRDWRLCMGPDLCEVKNLAMGVSVFPAGSTPPGHAHDHEEEVIYCVSGLGELRTPEYSVSLEPGTCVYVPIGQYHATASLGPEPLELVTAFSPPVVPGSYEVQKK
jgi:quercetin dioxygenase-like cupin family protein